MIRLIVSLFILLLTLGCKQQNTIHTKLIVVDEIIYGGFKIYYFIGYDIDTVSLFLKRNEYSVTDVDSNYIFILSKDEFAQLNNVLSSNSIKRAYNISTDSIYHTRIVQNKFYSSDTISEEYYLIEEFNEKIKDYWFNSLVQPKSEQKIKLIEALKKHNLIEQL